MALHAHEVSGCSELQLVGPLGREVTGNADAIVSPGFMPVPVAAIGIDCPPRSGS